MTQRLRKTSSTAKPTTTKARRQNLAAPAAPRPARDDTAKRNVASTRREAPKRNTRAEQAESTPSTKQRPAVLVLTSGGLDSAAAIAFFLEKKYEVAGLFVDYGQAAAEPERQAVERLAKHFGINVRTVSVRPGLGTGPGYVPGRNLLLASVALAHVPFQSGTIALGVHSGTAYPDCSQTFVSCVQRVFELYSDGRLLLSAPFLGWTKRDVFGFAKSRNVPSGITYSCEAGTDPPCGKCKTCLDIEELKGNAPE